MYDPDRAKQALEKAFKIIGNEDKRLIKDEALWLRVYLRLLSIKADILRNDGKIDEANKIFNKENKLLEQYKCLLKKKFGEKFYYREKAHIMNDKYDLCFDIAESKKDLKRVEFYVRECIDYSSKGGDKILEVSARNILALVKMLQAKNLEDFEINFKKEAIENLENSIKTAREIQSKSDELFAMINKIIFNLTLNRNDIVNFAKNVKNEAVKVPNIYIQATAELYLAYVLLTLNLNGEVYNLIHSAYKKLRDVRSTRRSLHLIARAVEVIADYRRRKMSLEVLLKYLDDISDCLYNENQRLSAWVLRNFVESIRNRGYVDEELLRFDGVKLLATL
jgi:DNA-binding transcriptional regulator YhcF (GntR family)